MEVRTKKEVFSIVERALMKKKRSLEHFNGEGWWDWFTKRHPTLSLCTSDPLSRTKTNVITKDNMSTYFSLLEETLPGCVVTKLQCSQLFSLA